MKSRHSWPWTLTALATSIVYLAWYIATKPRFVWALLVAAAFGGAIGVITGAIRLLAYTARLKRQ